MKILFIIPPKDFIGIEKFSYSILPHQGILSISSVLIKNKYKVDIIDCPVLKIDWKKLERILSKINFDIVGITGLTCFVENTIKTAKIIKRINQKSIIITGGPHFTYEFEEALNNDIDFIVRFEAEIIFLNLVNALKSKKELKDINGIVYKDKNGKIIVNKLGNQINNLDILPKLNWDLLQIKKYGWWFKKPYNISFNTSRGCGFNCNFCVLPSYWGKYKSYTPKRIVEEIKILKEKYKIKVVWFTDDDFLYNPQNFNIFCDLLIDSNLEIKWFFQTRIDRILNNKELIIKSKKAGAFFILTGIESYCQQGLDKINKKIGINQIIESINFLKLENFLTWLSFLVGFKNDNKDNFIETLKFAKKLKADIVTFSPVTLFPGNKEWKNYKKEMTLKIEDYKKFNMFDPVDKTDYLSIADIKHQIFKIYFKYYFRFFHVKNLFSNDRFKRKILWSLSLYGLKFLINPNSFYR